MKQTTFFAILISVVVVFFVNAPFLYYAYVPKNGGAFLAKNNINSEDTYTYVSFIEQARQGRIFFENQYTSEPQEAVLLRPSYLVIGLIARLTNISAILAFHLSRVILSFILCFVIYKFLHLFFKDERKILTTFALILTSCGLGFILKNYFPSSADLWIPEAITFLSLEQAPHFILSPILLLTGYYFFIKYLKTGNINLLVPTFFAFFALAFEHPFDLIVAIVVIFLTSLWHKKSSFTSASLAAFSGIGLIYQIFETLTNPVLKMWNAQNILTSPSPQDYLIGFGILIIFVIIGLELLSKELKSEQKFAIIWILVTALGLYAPINFQRRFVEGIQIPIAIVGTFGIYHLFETYRLKKVNLLAAVIVLTLSFGSVFTIYQDFQVYASDSVDTPYYFIKYQNLKAIEWLKTKTDFKDVILSNRYFGNIIPGLIARKVYFGHQTQTINFSEKIDKTNSFLLEKDDKKALSFLKENHITYIFFGIYDPMIQYGFRPDEKSYLKKIYENSGASIYKVIY